MPSDYQESKDRYLKEKVEEFKIRVPKGQKAVIQAYAKEQGKSLNSYVVGLIDEDMNRTASQSEPPKRIPFANRRTQPQLAAFGHEVEIIDK